MVSTFWAGRHPLFFFFAVPLLYLCLAFLVVMHVPSSLVPFNVLIDMVLVGTVPVLLSSFLLARSASKIDDERADAAPRRYATVIARLQGLKWLQIATTALLAAFAYETHDGQTIYSMGNPLLTVLVAVSVMYLTLLNLVLATASFARFNPLLVTRVNLMAETDAAGESPGFFASAFKSFNRHLKPQTHRRISPAAMDETLLLPRSERRVLALRLAASARNEDYADFLRVLAWTLGKNDVDEITEGTDLGTAIRRIADRWEPLLKWLYYILRVVVEIEKVMRGIATHLLAGLRLIRKES